MAFFENFVEFPLHFPPPAAQRALSSRRRLFSKNESPSCVKGRESRCGVPQASASAPTCIPGIPPTESSIHPYIHLQKGPGSAPPLLLKISCSNVLQIFAPLLRVTHERVDDGIVDLGLVAAVIVEETVPLDDAALFHDGRRVRGLVWAEIVE